jgi:hypothetical protein
MLVTKDGKLIGTHNDGTVKKAGVGIYDITFQHRADGLEGAARPRAARHLRQWATVRSRREPTCR